MSRRGNPTFECGNCKADNKPYEFPNAETCNEAKEEAKKKSAKCKGQNGRCVNLLQVQCYNSAHRCQSCYDENIIANSNNSTSTNSTAVTVHQEPPLSLTGLVANDDSEKGQNGNLVKFIY